ncbi:ChaN family lipoprotein [Algoriphagus vanfongensis]|uniref:ChaN family lipoprotein n=1 Tax=Algoriphagus vanfongensis TaxID=426371 RepID=UPI000423F1CA|nr:ChaN family lipoprotein [Algoriphagus vanfongensis]
MKKLLFTFSICLFIATITLAQNKPAYQLFDNRGKQADYDKMIRDLAKSDMVFFGEYHTNPISHWLQLEMCHSFYEIKGQDLYLGAEMFENGNQLVIDEYLQDLYPEDKMLPEITQLWSNYQTDYKPLLDFAKDKNLRFIATNIPRRYASLIHKKGIESLQLLSPEARAMIGPDLEKYFDPTVKAYAEMGKAMGDHIPPNMLNIQTAQAAKDATMAHFSIESFQPGNLLFHFQGSYHSNYSQGIIWWINQIRPGFTIKSITTLTEKEWKELSKEDRESIADYIIVVADRMTQTKR